MARKILLADDSVTAQNMGRKILADAGYEVVTVNNGSAALKKIAEIKPDLVILDVYMPGYSGLEVCQRLKESGETARIPVLLSVGKLEPFKPEEAQRARADGFIVKPFEASELLSALSKLEDKVVPRSEPSKPGRFARAMAAAEEADRYSEPTAENGWKSRIGFPRKKTEPEEKVAEDETIYNPINRDLRTVMETALEKEATQNAQSPAAENTVDVAALAPAGFPNGVTPEEVAAIAAAAAQIQIASAVAQDREEQASEFQVTEAPASQIPAPDIASPANLEPAASSPASALDVQATNPVAASADARSEEAKAEAPPADQIDKRSNSEEKIADKVEAIEEKVEAALEAKQEEKTVEAQGESQDVPVTMAVATESVVAANAVASRWTAVAVALDGEEAAISLDQEMQKAYAAFVAAEMPSAAEPASAAPAAENFVTAPFAAAAETQEAAPIPAAESEQPVPVDAASSHPIEVLEVSPSAETKVEDSLPEAEPAVAEIAAAVPEVVPDLDAVKNSAAAWATWSQTHDADVNATAAAEAKPAEFEAPAPDHEDSAAMAVAAGAEHIAQEVPEPSPENPADVASIVDSVLADLRPRLMAEISRKMAQKK